VAGHGGAQEAVWSLCEAEAKRKPALARRERSVQRLTCAEPSSGERR
jgi:hypothetical protein